MKIAYLDCLAGISGDMTLGALVDAGVDLEVLNKAVGSLGLPECRLVGSEVKKGAFRATKVDVLAAHEHVHRHLADIEEMIERGALSDRQKTTAKRLFRKLAEVEAKAHGTTIEKVHFHEVGAADSVADIVGSVVGFDLLGVDRVVVSPIPTGTGTIRIAHGLCSIPAPATAEILHEVPLAAADVEGEMTTPTGALIATELGDAFGPLPAMRIERIGIGAGSKDWPDRPNILRLILGESTPAPETRDPETRDPETRDPKTRNTVWLLETNLDDATGETIGHACERLWTAGALDVWTTPIGMKKGRAGVLLSVLAEASAVETLETLLFEETPTLGIRRRRVERTVLPRCEHFVETPYGAVRGKARLLPSGAVRFKPEYDACTKLASEKDVPLTDVFDAARGAFDPREVHFNEGDPPASRRCGCIESHRCSPSE